MFDFAGKRLGNKSRLGLVLLVLLCSSRKNPYPPHGRPLEIPRGRGF